MGTLSSKMAIPKRNPLPLTKLPSSVQQLIYEFAGREPLAQQAKNEFINLIKTGRIGIPAWETTINSNAFISCTFVTPSYDYYEYRKIYNNNWWFPTDLSNYYFNNGYGFQPQIINFTFRFKQFCWALRNDVFMKPGGEYLRFNEGGFENPSIPISFRLANDYDILYTLKQARGTIKDIEGWVKHRIHWGITKENQKYMYRILDKWRQCFTDAAVAAVPSSTAPSTH